ncbi:homeobox-leucine zipper protein ROC8-like [Hordeum vulgare]|nr:homeobox-leucine zipper protein ROC8-like [Hordeum vulgare]
MCEALKNFICLNYKGPPVVKDYFDEQKLRMENARLKEDLSRVTGLTSKSLDHPFMPMPLGMPQMSVSSLDLSIVGLSMHVHHQPLCAAA